MNEVSSTGIPLDNKPFVFGDKIMNRDIRPETRIIVRLKNQTVAELNGTTVSLDREADFSHKYHERIVPQETVQESVVEPEAVKPVDEVVTEEEAPKKKVVKKVAKKAKK